MKSQSLKLRKKERAKVGRSDRWVFVCVVIQSSQCKKKQRGCRKFLHKIYKKKKEKKSKERNKKETAQSSKRRNTCKTQS